jgi:hypothetical protein
MSSRPDRPVQPSGARCAPALAVICLWALAGHGAQATVDRGLSAKIDRAIPPQGLYEGCAPGPSGDACIAHLAAIRAAGFRYVLNYSAWYGSPTEILRYADAAAELGLQLIWPLNNPAWRGLGDLAATYSSLVGGDAGLSNAELASFAVRLVANHPATWGFYIGDELPAAEVGRVRDLSAAVRRLAPEKPQLYIGRPGIAKLRPFAGIADVAGADTYPIGSGDPAVGPVARSAQAAATAAGAQTAMVLQTFSWSQYAPTIHTPQYPNFHSLRAMRNAAIHYAHPSMILWYSYQDILRSDRPQQRWQELARTAFSPISPETFPYKPRQKEVSLLGLDRPSHRWDVVIRATMIAPAMVIRVHSMRWKRSSTRSKPAFMSFRCSRSSFSTPLKRSSTP